MKSASVALVSWLAGLAACIGVLAYMSPQDFAHTFSSLGYSGVFAWITLTLAARIFLAETIVAPLAALGFKSTRWDMFWINWLRSFANQIIPLSGIAAFAGSLRTRMPISWSELAALGSPLFVLSAIALGGVGLVAAGLNAATFGHAAIVLAAVYLGVICAGLAAAFGTARVLESLPGAVSVRIAKLSDSLRTLARTPGLLLRVTAYHAAAILLRGSRLWIIFAAADTVFGVRETLLVIAIAESSMLIQLTPGGLGVREGAVLGGAALLGVPVPVAASVALVDRIFMVALTALMVAPAVTLLRRPSD